MASESERRPTTADWNRGMRFMNPDTGLLHGHIRWPDGRPPVPSGCRRCGRKADWHTAYYVPYWGYHEWVPPTAQQVMLRMLARRRAREAGKNNTN